MDIMSLLMAKRAGGNTPSGGGSVNSVNGVKPDSAGNVALKYDDLKDRPFYEETGLVEILPETTFAVADPLEVTLPVVRFVVGEFYTVKWNGTEYNCKAFDLTEIFNAPIQVIGLGNRSYIDPYFENTEEPFIITSAPDENDCIFAVHDGSTSVTMSIMGSGTVIHPLDPKFLPEGVGGEIPFFDLEEMGLPALTLAETVSVSVDTTAIIAALEKGLVRLKVKFSSMDQVAVCSSVAIPAYYTHTCTWVTNASDGNYVVQISIVPGTIYGTYAVL